MTLLSEIHPYNRNWSVHVLVSRMWFYRGGTDNGPIKHIDLVLLDKEGNHMYAQIPPQPANRLKDEIEEGKVYLLTKFLCNHSRIAYRPVESPHMIQFTRFSDAVLCPGLEVDYPFCTYSLTEFEDIPRPSTTPARFIDVIGRITSVSDVISVQSMHHQPEPSNTRTIVLTNLRGQEIKLVLWGNRAVEFEDEATRARNEETAVIGIFVGTLPKNAQGTRSLSGSSACRWYIDEDLPVINAFRASLGNNFTPTAVYAPSEQGTLSGRVHEEPIEKTILELTQLDPFDNEERRFICTATIQRLNPDQRWWFFSCATCNTTSAVVGAHFRCAKATCTTIEADPTYCVSFFGSDEAAETEFVMFDKVVKAVVGKPLMTLLRYKYPGRSIQEIAQVPDVHRIPPSEVTRIVGQRYKLLVSIAKRSFAVNSQHLSFQVVRIMQTYKPELSSSAFDNAIGSPGASTSTTTSSVLLSPHGPFAPGTPNITPLHAACSSESLTIGTHTPTKEAPTPTSKGKDVLPAASPGKSPCPGKSARRALFKTPKKPAEPAEAAVPADETSEVQADGNDDASVTTAEDKEDNTHAPKNKRNTSGAKEGSGSKKARQ